MSHAVTAVARKYPARDTFPDAHQRRACAIAKLQEAVSALERRALAAEAKIEAMLAPIVK